jgi:hypothetical protein
MLFKVLDPAFVLSDTYRTWPLETKATFTVCVALGNYLTGEFHHATATIAYHADLSIRAVQRSLKRMEEAGQFTINGKPKKRSFVYNFAAAVTDWLTEKKRKEGRRAAEKAADEAAGQQLLDLENIQESEATGESFKATGESLTDESVNPPDPPQSPAVTDTNPDWQDPCSLFLTTEELTTTAHTAAEEIPEDLLELMISKHGSEKVVVTLGAMGNMLEASPDCFDNPSAYFRQCCDNGWVPTNKAVQDREKKRELDQAARRRQEELNQEFQRMREDSTDCDPLVAQKAIAEINAMLADVPAA